MAPRVDTVVWRLIGFGLSIGLLAWVITVDYTNYDKVSGNRQIRRTAHLIYARRFRFVGAM